MNNDDQSSNQYSGIEYWEDYHQIGLEKVRNREIKQEKWLYSFVPALQQYDCKSILDLGCGSGYDALALAALGFKVSGNDISQVAIDHARLQAAKAGYAIDYQQHDIALPMSYTDAQFDAVICNLTLHMFPVSIADAIAAEVYRCVRPGGLFMFHVNATEDLPYRSKLQPPVVPLGDEMYRFGKGQTMRFFSHQACESLLTNWQVLQIEPVRMLREDGQVQKCAWRCIARKP